MSLLSRERTAFHQALLAGVLSLDKNGVASNADSSSKVSREIARGIFDKLNSVASNKDARARLAGQSSGEQFEGVCRAFLNATFLPLRHLRPGEWTIAGGKGRGEIAKYEQYAHLLHLERAANRDPELRAALGSDYVIAPDIVISRGREPDDAINHKNPIVDAAVALQASLRAINGTSPLLHASISCKWTMRSDRAQNSRTEGLNLVKNRKGHLPHVVVVTGEPMPSRIASIALGTGEIDCVYHFALHELTTVVAELGREESQELVETMIRGNRLRDISDLPLDLAT